MPRCSAIAALARATAAAGVGPGSAVGAPVAVLALERPRAVAVATAVAAANRADLFILALLQECPGGLTPQGTRCWNVTARSPRVARGRELLPFPRARGQFRAWSVPGDSVAAWRRAQRLVVTVGDREVRVSSPDRVVYEATDWAPEVTKLQVCEYFIGVAPAFMRASGDRPVALERWPGGWREGMTLSVDSIGRQTGTASTRSASPRVLPIGSRPAAILTPNDRPIDELCLTEPAAAVWAAQMGTLTFHPWGCARRSRPPRRVAPRSRSTARRDLRRRPASEPGVARELLEELGLRGYPKTSGNRGIHIYVRIRPEWTFDQVGMPRSASAASSSAATTV